MPKKGYSSITINDKLKKQLSKIAKKQDCSIPEVIEELVKKETALLIVNNQSEA
jgi:predicted CopG family antitoxin